MRGGCRARAPPDVSQAEMEVTWEGGQGHQESRGGPCRGHGRAGAPAITSTPALPIRSSPAPRALTLHLPPGLTVCSGRPRSGWGGGGSQPGRRCLALLGPEPASTIFHWERPAAMGAASLANAPSSLAFPSFCEDASHVRW